MLDVDYNGSTPKFYSATSSYTYMYIDSYTAGPRTDAYGTRITFRMKIVMGSGSALGTHSTDQSLGRVVRGTINGQDIGTIVIKRYNLDAWASSTTYTYDLTVDIPYATGDLAFNIQVVPQGTGAYGTQWVYGATSTFTTGNNAYKVTASAGVVPSVPTTPTLDGQAFLELTTITGIKRLAWGIPFISGTGGIQRYDIYGRKNDGSWSWIGQSGASTRYYDINLATYASILGRGDKLYAGIRAVGLYGSSTILTGPYVQYVGVPIQVKVSGTWKTGYAKVRIGGLWKEVTAVFAKVAGTWREVT